MSNEVIKCPICNSKKIQFRGKFRNNNSCFDDLKRMACLDCDLQFAYPIPDKEKLLNYNSSYHLSAHGGINREVKLESFFTGLAKTRLYFIKENCKLNKNYPYKVLEIGPGPGAFVKVWMEYFSNSLYYVIESDKSCYEELSKKGVIFFENKSKESEFDFIILSHVLEHVSDPLDFLSSFIKLLKKDGHLFIEVPCMDWRHKDIDEPHLLFFDKLPMEILLNRLNLKKIHIAYYGTLHSHLLNPLLVFFKRIRSFLWKKGISYFHFEKHKIYSIVKDEFQTQALLNFDAHKEQNQPAWWLRVISKKQ